MINRVLIRIKTVQLLYSYLLVQKPFSLESQPSAPTKEKRFAYNLYLDCIYLFYQLAKRVRGKGKTFPLLKTRLIGKLENDEIFKTLKIKYSSGNYPFAQLEDGLTEEIEKSLLLRELENNIDGTYRDLIWEEIFKSIILPNRAWNALVATLPGYSLSGIDRMKALMEETFRNFYSTRDDITDALKMLSKSMDEARELYIRLLALPVELTQLRTDNLIQNRRKPFATVEDLNPNMRMSNNIVPEIISKNPIFEEYIEKNKISWRAEDPELLELLLKQILESDIYRKYVESDKENRKSDIEFWRNIFRDIIFQSPDFLEYMETKSVFWNDDLEITGTFILKTLKKMEESSEEDDSVLPMYKDEEDSRFGAELFKMVIDNKEQYKTYIDKALEKDKWDSERLAFMDVVITMTALAEILNFPKIPLVASINEYLEIAKSYSTEKSGSFVHGLLASIIKDLQKSGELNKV